MLMSEIFIQPRRITILSDKDLKYYIKNYNGKKNIYQSVYQYENSISVDNAIVDKIFLDFDFNSDMQFLKDVRVIATYLYENDYSFYIRFSGNGFHIFILLKENLQNPKNAIKQYVNHLHKQTKTTSDPAVIGDLRRVTRVLNTLNMKHKERYYCIPITYDELMNLTYEDIRSLAKHSRHFCDFINGHRLLDISEWDNILFSERKNNSMQKISNINAIDNSIPPCVQDMMKQSNLGNLGRVQVILFFRDLGYTKDEVEDILFNFLSEEKFHHSVFEEHQIDYLFEKDYLFSNCYQLKENGFCTEENCQGHKLYY